MAAMAQSISDEQILTAALAVIAERGYVGATTKQIAARAGVNEVTLFRRFGNKQQLMRSVVENQATHFGGSDIVWTGDVEADLLRVVQYYANLVAVRGPMLMMLLSELPKQPDLMEMMDVPRAKVADIVLLLSRYQSEGVLAAQPPIQAFAALVGPIFLATMMQHVLSLGEGVSAEPAAIVKTFLSGHATKAQG